MLIVCFVSLLFCVRLVFLSYYSIFCCRRRRRCRHRFNVHVVICLSLALVVAAHTTTALHCPFIFFSRSLCFWPFLFNVAQHYSRPKHRHLTLDTTHEIPNKNPPKTKMRKKQETDIYKQQQKSSELRRCVSVCFERGILYGAARDFESS